MAVKTEKEGLMIILMIVSDKWPFSLLYCAHVLMLVLWAVSLPLCSVLVLML